MRKHYPDPYKEALSRTAHTGVRLALIVAPAVRIYQAMRHRKDALDARDASGDTTATYDFHWLSHANLSQTARAWRMASSHADTESTAAEAMQRCEDRLRTLHPYAMARYDRLRNDGMRPADAMKEVAPLFACRPYAYAGQSGPSPPAVEPIAARRSASDLVAEDFPRDIEAATRAAMQTRSTGHRSPPQLPSTPQPSRRSVR